MTPVNRAAATHMLTGAMCDLALHSGTPPTGANEIGTLPRTSAVIRWGFRGDPAASEFEHDVDLTFAELTPRWASVGCWRHGVARTAAGALLATSTLVSPLTNIAQGQIARLTPAREKMRSLTVVGALEVLALAEPEVWRPFGDSGILEKFGLSGAWLELAAGKPGSAAYAAAAKSLRAVTPGTASWTAGNAGRTWATSAAIVVAGGAAAVENPYVATWDSDTGGNPLVILGQATGELAMNGMATIAAGGLTFGYEPDPAVPA